jgi:hypothetical protein
MRVYFDDANWPKFALELSVYREPTIVTVVTRGVSDDCNSSVVGGGSIWYRTRRLVGHWDSTTRRVAVPGN